MVLAGCPCAFALNPSLDVSQYSHTRWDVSKGFSRGAIRAIAQTLDGYMWVGTDFGLFRFDGVRAVPWEPPAGEHLPGAVTRLSAGRDGALWIGTLRGLASWTAGKLKRYPELEGRRIEALLEDREGTMWVGGWAASAGTLCSIKSGSAQCAGIDGRLASGVTALYEDREGNLWAGGMGSLWRWKPGPPTLYTLADPGQPMYALTGSDDGGILICRRNGVAKLKNGQIEAYPLAGGPEFKPARLLRDRHGSLWVGAVVDKGLIHVHEGRIDLFTATDGLSGGAVTSLIEDFEGNIWVATLDGLDRFREFAIPSISLQQGVSSQGVFSILAASDGSLWLGTSNGFDRWNGSRMTIYRRRSMRAVGGGVPSAQPAATLQEIIDPGLPEDTANALFEDQGGELWVGTFNGVAVYRSGRFFHVESVPPGFVYSITGDHAGNVWISHQDALFRFAHSGVVQRIPWNKLGRREPATALIHDPVEGGLWLGFRDGGIAFLDNDQLRASYSGPQGLGEGMIGSLYMDGNRTLWAGTEGGLSRIKGGRVLTLTSKNGLPCNMVHWMRDDNAQGVWLYLACGLVRIPRSELDGWVSDATRKIGMTHFDTSDGVRSRGTYAGSDPVVAKAADGKLWFRQPDGVGIIDPRNLAWNALPPPVHIESIEADDKPYDLRPGLRLPPRVRDLSIDFTALSLVAPEKMHFKYLLEGQDPGWREVINQRRVQYTNLPPRNYVFRVMASNNSGVWNETGDSLAFSIVPAYYQTNWFRALLAALVLAFMGAAYQFRIWQVQREARRLRDVIETIPAYVWSALPDGFVDFVNRRWLEFSGFSLNHAVGWGWADAVHPEDRDRLLEAWRGALASGEALETEARMRSADGPYRWVLIRGVPQRDRSGKIVKWYGKSTDIDDRKRAEETLRETETRFRTYIDHATDAFFVLDFERGTILDVNRRACENLGYTREEIIGKTVFDFDAALDPEFLDQNIRPRIEAGESVTFETRHRRKDGSVFPVELRARAFRIGGRVFNLSLALDITERKQAEEEHKRAEEERERLRQLEADLAHINRVSMMGELAASVAHEVNQPLTGIVSNGSACLRFLAGDVPDVEEAREALRDIVRDGKRAGEVIARIRALTKRAAPPRERLDLNETVQEVLTLIGDEARKRSVVIRTHFADDLVAVSGDRVQLQQVLLNLVINAMDAMSSVEDRARQLVMTTRNIDSDRVQVTVEDSGTGLDPNLMTRIFDAFYTTKSGGMGMGLSISRSIVQNHGGRLWATANEGPGTSFHFTLPKYQEEEKNMGARSV